MPTPTMRDHQTALHSSSHILPVSHCFQVCWVTARFVLTQMIDKQPVKLFVVRPNPHQPMYVDGHFAHHHAAVTRLQLSASPLPTRLPAKQLVSHSDLAVHPFFVQNRWRKRKKVWPIPRHRNEVFLPAAQHWKTPRVPGKRKVQPKHSSAHLFPRAMEQASVALLVEVTAPIGRPLVSCETGNRKALDHRPFLIARSSRV